MKQVLLALFFIFPLLLSAQESEEERLEREAQEYQLAFEEMILRQGRFYNSITPDRILFGPEFTFWVPLLNENGQPYEDGRGNRKPVKEMHQVYLKLRKHLVEGQAPQNKFDVDINFDENNEIDYAQFSSQYGWDLLGKIDLGVLEFTMKPMTVEDYQRFDTNIEDAIFTTVKNEGYFPSLFGGGGHVNMSLGYLKARPLLFRNFIVDLLNHNELFLGVFGFDTNNALSPSMLQKEEWLAIKTELNFMDAYGLELESIEAFLEAFNRITYDSSDPFVSYWHPNDGNWRNRKKHSAFRFLFHKDENERIVGLGERMEFRAVRPQQSIDQWIRQIRLFESRIKYLETLTEPIPLNPKLNVVGPFKLPKNKKKAARLAHTPPVDPQEALAAFHEYVTESGEKWEDHQDYLWPAWITDGEIERFNRKFCDGLLGGNS